MVAPSITRLRKLWGDDTIFRGSALTFGTVVYHGDAPFQRYTLTEQTSGPNFLFAPRGTTSRPCPDSINPGPPIISRYFSRILSASGNSAVVGSFRLDHEDIVEVDSSAAPWLVPVPPTGPASISADHWVPLRGFGMGNDFGNRNETYFNVLRVGARRGFSTSPEPPARSHSVSRYRTRSIRWTSN